MAPSFFELSATTPPPACPPGLRLHVDGGVYRLLGCATNAGDLRPAAVYEHLHPFEPGVWTRPLDEFNVRFLPLGPTGAAALMAIDRATRQADIASRKALRREREAAELAAAELKGRAGGPSA